MAQGGFAKEHLRSFIERIQRLEEEKSAIAADIREVYAEAKAKGFDPRIMRMCVALLKLDTAEREERQAVLDLYMGALTGGETISVETEVRATRLIEAAGEACA